MRTGRTSRALGAACVMGLLAGLLPACGGGGGGDAGGVDGGGSGTCQAPTVLYDGTVALPDTGSITVAGGVFALSYTRLSTGSVPSDCPSAASFVDGASGATVEAAAMRAGMHVQANSLVSDMTTGSDGRRHGDAFIVRLMADVVGTVDAVDAVHGSLVVAGQSVVVDAGTQYGGTSGLVALAPGQPVRVHGLLDADADTWHATRIDVLDATPAADVATASLRMLDPSARTFHLGALLVHYDGLVDAPALTEGEAMQVTLAPGSGTDRSATHIAQLVVGSVTEASVEGLVAHWDGASGFTLPGYEVDAHAARIVDALGLPASLSAGAHVIVHGTPAPDGTTLRLQADAVTVMP